ncbi:MAG: hypothetical protein GXO23_05500 [Crenarchaeota archaeon]|nr:hypothetical protein [Thermoproteota archaeon]
MNTLRASALSLVAMTNANGIKMIGTYKYNDGTLRTSLDTMAIAKIAVRSIFIFIMTQTYAV